MESPVQRKRKEDGTRVAAVGHGGARWGRVRHWSADDVYGVRDGERGGGLGGDEADWTYVLGREVVILCSAPCFAVYPKTLAYLDQTRIAAVEWMLWLDEPRSEEPGCAARLYGRSSAI